MFLLFNVSMNLIVVHLLSFSVTKPSWNFWWHCHWLSVSNEFFFYFFLPLLRISIYIITCCKSWFCFICSYVECTSASIQALVSFRRLYPGHRREEIEKCIKQAASFIEKIQAEDGSWFVSRSFLYSVAKSLTGGDFLSSLTPLNHVQNGLHLEFIIVIW